MILLFDLVIRPGQLIWLSNTIYKLNSSNLQSHDFCLSQNANIYRFIFNIRSMLDI